MTHRRTVPHTTTLVLALGLMPGLASSGLTDPTRPLAGLSPADTVSASAPRGAAPVAVPAPPPAEPQLQSLQLPRDGQASALVDGQLLRVGQRWNAFEILAIDAQGVLAKGPGGPQRWTLVGVQYLDPKARARPTPVLPPQPVALAPSAVSAAPESTTPVPLHTAQWQFTPRSAPTAVVPLPPVTRLSWADLVAPSPQAPAPAATPRPRPQVLRLPATSPQAMPAAAGPGRARPQAALAQARAPQTPTWRGLRFEWPARAEALPRKPVSSARGPLRGPVPPSLVLVKRQGPGGAALRWSASSLSGESSTAWWTPAPAMKPPLPLTTAAAVAAPVGAHRATSAMPATRTWARVATRQALVTGRHEPMSPVMPRTPGPRLVGVVALNKETP